MAPSPLMSAEEHRLNLQAFLENVLPGEDTLTAYFQKPGKTGLEYPCAMYNRDRTQVKFADNIKFFLKKRWTVTVMDRNPDSDIPDLIEALSWCELDRTFVTDGINHWVFTLHY